ncbi:MAG: methyltransferase domain-containing protein [Bacteroides sp.]|nr:methyltransferase domain-containing protein [Bacteroides sp.]
MTAIDLGCGPGFFTREMAHLVGASGKVYAADLQQGMLDKLKQKINGIPLQNRITLCRYDTHWLNIPGKADLMLACYMIHEVPDQDRLFREFSSLLNPGGKILIIEPRFHVKKRAFTGMVQRLKEYGFNGVEKPEIFFSRSILMEKDGDKVSL